MTADPTPTVATPQPDGGAEAEAAEATRPLDGQPRRRRVRLLVAIAALTLVADAVSKLVVVRVLADRDPVVLVRRVLDLQLTRNAGAAFSVGGGATLLLTLVAVAVVVAIARTAPRLTSTGWAVVLGLLLGGALGNLSDRLLRAPGPGRGAVVDWIHLAHWPVFNAADSAIVCGGVLAVVLSLRGVHATDPADPTDPTVPAVPAVPAARDRP